VKNKILIFPTLTACLLLFLVVGCAGLSPKASDKKATLEERVQKYMQAQVDQQWNTAYSFLNASSREQTPREQYIQQTRKATYTGFEIDEINVLPEGDKAKVRVRIDISFMGFELKRAPHNQEWVKEKGVWYVNIHPEATLIDK
jgi:hypothetical protein